MRSAAPRFPREGNKNVPFGVYDLDSTINKRTIETTTRGEWAHLLAYYTCVRLADVVSDALSNGSSMSTEQDLQQM